MDRIIEVKVCGSHLTKDSNKAGTKGESNMTRLRITFDENWEDFAKRVLFWDAYGQNPVKVVLGVNLIEDIQKSTRVYLVPIPAEAMARAGWLTFSIQGTLDNKNQVAITSKLEVDDSPDILDPLEPTPSELEQVQAEIETIKEGLKDLDTAHKESEENAKIAKESADKAVATVGKSSYIGDNGNWYAWDIETSEFYDTGVKAQSGSMVYVGTNPTDDADVWINTNENNLLYVRHENGEFIPIPTIAGKDGKSAYDQAVEAGYTGSLEQFTTLLNNLTYTIEADHLSDTTNPHKVTAKQAGAIPEAYYLSNDLNTELQQGGGKMTVCYYSGGTLNTPKTEGLTDYAHGMVITNAYTAQYGTQLCLPSGDYNMYLRRYNKNGITPWFKLSPEDIKSLQEIIKKLVLKSGDTMTGPLIIDKDTAWGHLVLYSPSGYYRSFETNDSVIRIDARDEQLTSKRRYLELCTNTYEADVAKALRVIQENDGSSFASYVLHTNNINKFVVSNGSFIGDSQNSTNTKTIPIRKTTQAVIYKAEFDSANVIQFCYILHRGVQKTTVNLVNINNSNNEITLEWGDDYLTINGYAANRINYKYNYTLIG